MTYNDVGIATVIATYAMFVVALARLAFRKISERHRDG